jgi:hypothetical protein
MTYQCSGMKRDKLPRVPKSASSVFGVVANRYKWGYIIHTTMRSFVRPLAVVEQPPPGICSRPILLNGCDDEILNGLISSGDAVIGALFGQGRVSIQKIRSSLLAQGKILHGCSTVVTGLSPSQPNGLSAGVYHSLVLMYFGSSPTHAPCMGSVVAYLTGFNI